MRCIFCKGDSSASRSVEHIMPESLGNRSHTLPKGIVCDNCNNYFATKVEKIVLELPYFKSLRARHFIETKKGRIIPHTGFFTNPFNEEVQVNFLNNQILQATISNASLFDEVLNGKFKKLYMPMYTQPPIENKDIAKFLGKMAIEALAQRVMMINDWEEDFINNEGLDQLRDFVRYNKGYKVWPYKIRQIYNEAKIFKDDITSEYYQLLHEYDFLMLENEEVDNNQISIKNLYFICAIMGVEYTINVTNAGLSAYEKWLVRNNHKSILQMEKYEYNSN